MTGSSLIRQAIQKSTRAQRVYRWYKRRGREAYYPVWQDILATDPALWKSAVERSPGGVRVLLASSIGNHPTLPIMDSFLAPALTLRGASVSFLLCDALLPACVTLEVGLMRARELKWRGPRGYFCRGCFAQGHAVFEPFRLPIVRYSDQVTPEERRQAEHESQTVPVDDIAHYVVDGVAVGEHALAGALRYFARSTLDGLLLGEWVLRYYFRAALLAACAARRTIRSMGIEVVCVNHGIYVPHGIVAEVGRTEGCRVVTWNVAYRKRSFIFSHRETYHHSLMTEPASEWEDMAWSEQHEKDIVDYLVSRRRGGRDWIVFQARNAQDDLRKIAQQIPGLDFNRPCIGMLTNVAWDAQLHYRANAFSNMLEWVVKTVGYFAGRPDLQLIIRVHPAEVTGDIKSRQPVVDEIKAAFPALPANVFVIPPEQTISTYALTDACNAVIIFGTKTGVELTSFGIPVIVAGEAWIRNKGLTIDAQSEKHYFEILDRLPLEDRMSEAQVRRARKYAYHFFFRRMIPVSNLEPTGREPQFQVACAHLADLLPGNNPGLDVICDGIMTGSPFIYHAETAGTKLD